MFELPVLIAYFVINGVLAVSYTKYAEDKGEEIGGASVLLYTMILVAEIFVVLFLIPAVIGEFLSERGKKKKEEK